MSIFDIFNTLFEKDDPAVKTINLKGLVIKIECVKGDKRDPKAEHPITSDYGYIQGTEDPDEGDSIDVYVGEDLESNFVFKLKQLDKDYKFDEYKFMLGFSNKEDAIRTYLDSKPPFFSFGGADQLEWKEFEKYVGENKR